MLISLIFFLFCAIVPRQSLVIDGQTSAYNLDCVTCCTYTRKALMALEREERSI